MVWFKAPPCLQHILYSKIVHFVLQQCPTTDKEIQEFYKQVSSIRKYFGVLPPTVFEQLAETAFKSKTYSIRDPFLPLSGRYNYSTQFYLLEIFLQEQTQHVVVDLRNFIPPLHFSRLLEILSERNQRLISLTFKSGNVAIHPAAEDYQRFKQILSSARNLTHLTLRRICTDEVLGVIGKECCNLTELDVSFSPITDVGINLLTQNITELNDYIGDDDNSEWESTFWRLPHVFLPVCRLIPVRDLALEPNEIKRYSRTKSPLCLTLRKIYVGGSHVSSDGIMVALELLENLEVFGDWLDLVFQYLVSRQWRLQENQSQQLKVRHLEISYLTDDIMNLVRAIFPLMRELKIDYVSEYVTNDNMPILDSLVVTIGHGFMGGNELSRVNQYLSSKGQSLRELFIVSHTFTHDEMNISPILAGCTNLNILRIRSFIFQPMRLNYALTQHIFLKNVHFNSIILQDSLLNLLKRVPNIEEIVIGGLQNRTEHFISNICDISPRSKWKSFWVNRENVLETEEELILFINAFDQIKVLGRLPPPLKKFGFETLNSEDDNYLYL